MAGIGPPPTPTAILKARGSWRAKIRKNEPQPPAGKAECPEWLSLEAKAAWKKLAPTLERMGVLTLADENEFARYCDLYARWKQAITRRVPKDKLIGSITEQLARLAQQFGLTPASRARVQVKHESNEGTKEDLSFFRVGRPA